MEKKKQTEKEKAAAAAAVEQAELEMLLPFLDKYELIKYRRSRALLNQQNVAAETKANAKGPSSRKRDSSSKTISEASDKTPEKTETRVENS
ncbi:hypothetical protein EVAR_73362_1 [Eumeta japonica]|uniref:Uncharacterized protein n=1 Tax=Eumeta variegata TaxID=151549 RepID=A0A4C1ST88_EUMVA|nr:hypothetical protein EVAR_73362_1 [Eumeta japonica]